MNILSEKTSLNLTIELMTKLVVCQFNSCSKVDSVAHWQNGAQKTKSSKLIILGVDPSILETTSACFRYRQLKTSNSK